MPREKNPNSVRASNLTTVCLVCKGPSAAHTHYGAICCYSCRAFFRRGIRRNYACVRGDNSCQVNSITRTNCKRCRYERCLVVGMKPALVDACLRKKVDSEVNQQVIYQEEAEQAVRMIDQNGRIFDQSGRIIDQLIDQNGGQIMAQEMAPDLGNVIDASSLIHSQQISQQMRGRGGNMDGLIDGSQLLMQAMDNGRKKVHLELRGDEGDQGLDLEDPGLQGGGAVIPEGSQPVRQQTYYIFHPVTQTFEPVTIAEFMEQPVAEEVVEADQAGQIPGMVVENQFVPEEITTEIKQSSSLDRSIGEKSVGDDQEMGGQKVEEGDGMMPSPTRADEFKLGGVQFDSRNEDHRVQFDSRNEDHRVQFDSRNEDHRIIQEYLRLQQERNFVGPKNSPDGEGSCESLEQPPAPFNHFAGQGVPYDGVGVVDHGGRSGETKVYMENGQMMMVEEHCRPLVDTTNMQFVRVEPKVDIEELVDQEFEEEFRRKALRGVEPVALRGVEPVAEVDHGGQVEMKHQPTQPTRPRTQGSSKRSVKPVRRPMPPLVALQATPPRPVPNIPSPSVGLNTPTSPANYTKPVCSPIIPKSHPKRTPDIYLPRTPAALGTKSSSSSVESASSHNVSKSSDSPSLGVNSRIVPAPQKYASQSTKERRPGQVSTIVSSCDVITPSRSMGGKRSEVEPEMVPEKRARTETSLPYRTAEDLSSLVDQTADIKVRSADPLASLADPSADITARSADPLASLADPPADITVRSADHLAAIVAQTARRADQLSSLMAANNFSPLTPDYMSPRNKVSVIVASKAALATKLPKTAVSPDIKTNQRNSGHTSAESPAKGPAGSPTIRGRAKVPRMKELADIPRTREITESPRVESPREKKQADGERASSPRVGDKAERPRAKKRGSDSLSPLSPKKPRSDYCKPEDRSFYCTLEAPNKFKVPFLELTGSEEDLLSEIVSGRNLVSINLFQHLGRQRNPLQPRANLSQPLMADLTASRPMMADLTASRSMMADLTPSLPMIVDMTRTVLAKHAIDLLPNKLKVSDISDGRMKLLATQSAIAISLHELASPVAPHTSQSYVCWIRRQVLNTKVLYSWSALVPNIQDRRFVQQTIAELSQMMAEDAKLGCLIGLLVILVTPKITVMKNETEEILHGKETEEIFHNVFGLLYRYLTGESDSSLRTTAAMLKSNRILTLVHNLHRCSHILLK